MTQPLDVLITGGTGYVGQRLIAELLTRGHRVRALARPSSAHRVPAGASAVVGDALNTGIPAANILINCTHTHHAPSTISPGSPAIVCGRMVGSASSRYRSSCRNI